jgi:hypothetical protein
MNIKSLLFRISSKKERFIPKAVGRITMSKAIIKMGFDKAQYKE